MFNTLGNFSAVYFTLAAVLFILILFEKHFIRLEEKLKAKRSRTGKSVKAASYTKSTHKNVQKNAAYTHSRVASVRRIPDNAA
ncbi:MAG: hypothetical protein E7543_00400 [Ruminococcaceae bacterium]|nr:hypothetical protein [Oscillospiraceae bacterium]MBQ9913369.1 hypothetical protein [Clostridia bacterium]